MVRRKSLAALVALLCLGWGNADESEDWCDRVCTGKRKSCPPAPECPVPVCPSPVVNLTCPVPICPPPVCPSPAPLPECPTVPSLPQCPPCPTCAPVSSPSITKPLPPGYVLYDNVGLFKFYIHEVDWLRANYTCFLDGGYLAVPKTKAELASLVHILKGSRSRKAFIGFHDFYNEGDYRTALGNPMNRFQRNLWGSGEPDGGERRNAVYLRSNGRIYDYYNTGTYSFICELPLKTKT